MSAKNIVIALFILISYSSVGQDDKKKQKATKKTANSELIINTQASSKSSVLNTQNIQNTVGMKMETKAVKSAKTDLKK